jgi:hypothetical protein
VPTDAPYGSEESMLVAEIGKRFDIRDPAQVFEHVGPLPHPTQDQQQ